MVGPASLYYNETRHPGVYAHPPHSPPPGVSRVGWWAQSHFLQLSECVRARTTRRRGLRRGRWWGLLRSTTTRPATPVCTLIPHTALRRACLGWVGGRKVIFCN